MRKQNKKKYKKVNQFSELTLSFLFKILFEWQHNEDSKAKK